MKSRQIVVLAAGKGTRMNADIPKVLFEIKNRPMISYLATTLKKVDLDNKPVAVVGYQSQKVKDFLGEDFNYVLQTEQLGTGHAVACAKDLMKDFEGSILILYGDMPLISSKTIDQVFALHEKNNSMVTMATAVVENFDDWREGFYSFGRILRNKEDEIVGIQEKADCRKEELKITEVNPSYFCFDSKWLWENIEKLQTDNNQGELYLTDLVKVAFDQGLKINSIQIESEECLGINTVDNLIAVEKRLKKS